MNEVSEPRIVQAEVVHEDERVRVSRLILEEGDRTSVHTHEYDELVVTVTGRRIRSRNADDRPRNDYSTEPGDVRFFPAPRDAHYIENIGPGPYVCVVIEPKATRNDQTAAAAGDV